MGRTLFIGEIIGPDILIILAIVMLLFGSSKIPKLARSLGQASHEFRKGVAEGAVDDAHAPPPINANVVPVRPAVPSPPVSGANGAAVPVADSDPRAGASH